MKALGALQINIEPRFSDFDAIAYDIKIFQNTLNADIKTIALELRIGMIDLQCSDIFNEKYLSSLFLEFYKSLLLTQLDQLHKFIMALFRSALSICVKLHSAK